MIDEARLEKLLTYRSRVPLQQQADHALAESIKLGREQMLLLRKNKGKSKKFRKLSREVDRLREEENRLSSIMVDRNLIGKQLEQAERFDEAIALYEANLADRFSGSFPYNRLAILYRKNKQYDEEIRVLSLAIEVFLALPEVRADKHPKLEKFNIRLQRVEYLKQK